MGTGSFGGGSGSFGGGSGGSAYKAGVDSSHSRILALTRLTESVNENPEIVALRAIIYRLLQDRARSAFFQSLLGDSLVVSAYQALLDLDAKLRGGMPLQVVAGKQNIALADLAETIWGGRQGANADERVESIVRRAVTDMFLRTVKNNPELYYDTPIDQLRDNFDHAPLRNTADQFLGVLIGEAVRRDLLSLASDAKAVLAKASHEIAVSWVDRFGKQKKSLPLGAMLQTIAAEYTAYSGGREDE